MICCSSAVERALKLPGQVPCEQGSTGEVEPEPACPVGPGGSGSVGPVSTGVGM